MGAGYFYLRHHLTFDTFKSLRQPRSLRITKKGTVLFYTERCTLALLPEPQLSLNRFTGGHDKDVGVD